MGQPVLICDPDESSRDRIRDALINTIPLVMTDSLEMATHLAASRQQYRSILLFVDGSDQALSFLEKTRAAAGTTRITAMVDRGNDAAGESAVRHGANGYVVRPLRTSDLLTLV